MPDEDWLGLITTFEDGRTTTLLGTSLPPLIFHSILSLIKPGRGLVPPGGVTMGFLGLVNFPTTLFQSQLAPFLTLGPIQSQFCFTRSTPAPITFIHGIGDASATLAAPSTRVLTALSWGLYGTRACEGSVLLETSYPNFRSRRRAVSASGPVPYWAI